MSCSGTIALSANLAESLEALFIARIPKDWLKKSWEAATLGNWFLGLLQRHDQLSKWLSGGRPKAYWLTGFFNPQASYFLCSYCLTFSSGSYQQSEATAKSKSQLHHNKNLISRELVEPGVLLGASLIISTHRPYLYLWAKT